MNRFTALLILLICCNFSLGIAQTLPSDFYPDFSRSRHHTFKIGEWFSFRSNLNLKAVTTGSQECCDNFFTQKRMTNYSFTISIKNFSNDLTYFVRIPQSGTVYRGGVLAVANHSDCGGGPSAYIGIWSQKKSYRLEPGDEISVQAKTKMDYDDYYPITEDEHEDLLGKNAQVFEPHCMHLDYYVRAYNKKQIQDILNQNNGNNPPTNPPPTNPPAQPDEEPENKTKEGIKIPEGTLDAADVILNKNKEDNANLKAQNYDPALCSKLKSEIDNWLKQLNNINSNNVQSLMSNFESFQTRMTSMYQQETLNPACYEEVNKIVQEFLNTKMSQLNGQMKSMLNKGGSGRTIQLGPNKFKLPKFAPPAMTPTFNKTTPSLKGDKFGKGKLKSNTSKGKKYNK